MVGYVLENGMNARADGNSSDFEALIEQHSSVLKRVASTYEVNSAKQQELFQEISLAVWIALPAFKGESNIKTYILRIAHNCSVKHVAKEVADGKYTDKSVDDTVEEGLNDIDGAHTLEQKQKAQRLMHHVRQLPLQNRQIFALLMEGLSYKDIAQISGFTVQHTGVLIMRIKKQLSEAMANER